MSNDFTEIAVEAQDQSIKPDLVLRRNECLSASLEMFCDVKLNREYLGGF